MQLYGKPPQLLEHHPIEPQSTGAITKHQPDRAQPASIAYSGWGFWCNIWNTTPSNRRAAEPARVVYRVNVLDHFLMAALSPPHRTPSSVWLYNFSECPAVFFYGLDKKKLTLVEHGVLRQPAENQHPHFAACKQPAWDQYNGARPTPWRAPYIGPWSPFYAGQYRLRNHPLPTIFYFGRVDHEVDDIIDKLLIHCKTGSKLRKELKKVAPIGRTEKGPEAIILVPRRPTGPVVAGGDCR